MNSTGDDDKLLVLDVEHGVGAGDGQDWHIVACQGLEEKIFLRIFPAREYFLRIFPATVSRRTFSFPRKVQSVA